MSGGVILDLALWQDARSRIFGKSPKLIADAYPQHWVTVGKAYPMAIKDRRKTLGATDSGARPGRFPLGSAQSRAAARTLLDARRSEEGAGTLFVFERIGGGHGPGRGWQMNRKMGYEKLRLPRGQPT